MIHMLIIVFYVIVYVLCTTGHCCVWRSPACFDSTDLYHTGG